MCFHIPFYKRHLFINLFAFIDSMLITFFSFRHISGVIGRTSSYLNAFVINKSLVNNDKLHFIFPKKEINIY